MTTLLRVPGQYLQQERVANRPPSTTGADGSSSHQRGHEARRSGVPAAGGVGTQDIDFVR